MAAPLPAPSARSVGADLWSGFASGNDGFLTRPGPGDRPDPVTHSSGGFGLGLGLTADALAGMAAAGGAAVIPARRPRD